MISNLINFYILSIISGSSDRIRIKRSSLESSHRDESKGGHFIPIRSLDPEIIDETMKIWHLIFIILRHLPFRLISRDPVIVSR